MPVSVLQRDVARLWMGMVLCGSCGPGSLSVCDSEGGEALPFALACVGAGGAVLLLVRDRAGARAALQAGAVDFAVETLSEALRVLKNEVRQGRPLGVALLGDAAGHVASMVERGVQPQWVCAGGGWGTLVARGAVMVQPREWTAAGVAGAGAEGLVLVEDVAESAAGRRAGDGRLREALEGCGDGAAVRAARQWMVLAPRLFPRERERSGWQRMEGQD